MVPVTKSKRRRLPDLCLLALFDQMPLEDRLSAHKVSSRWGQLVREASRSVNSLTIAEIESEKSLKFIEKVINMNKIGNLTSVKLLRNEDGCTPLYPLRHLTKWNCLKFSFDSLDTTKVQQILDIFFATTQLTYASNNKKSEKFGDCVVFEHLIKMLQDRKWRHQLVAFELFDLWQQVYKELSIFPSNKAVFKAINALSALRHLTISFENLTMKDLPILGQLKEVHFTSDCQTNMDAFERSLNRYASSNADLRVYLEDSDFFPHLNDHLCDRIAYSNSISGFIGSQFICNHYRSLTSLDLNVSPSVQLFTDLSKLHQLVHLSLGVYFTSLSNDFDESVRPTAQLKSVKALDLHLTITSHSQLQWLYLPWTVPNVQAIYLESLTCESCDINNWTTYDDASKRNTARQCYCIDCCINNSTTYDDASKRDTARQCLCSALQVLKQTGVSLCKILCGQPGHKISTAEELLTPTEV